MSRRIVVEEPCSIPGHDFWCEEGSTRTVLEGIPDVDARLLGSALEYWEGFEFGDPLGDIGALPIILRSARWVAAVFGETQ